MWQEIRMFLDSSIEFKIYRRGMLKDISSKLSPEELRLVEDYAKRSRIAKASYFHLHALRKEFNTNWRLGLPYLEAALLGSIDDDLHDEILMPKAVKEKDKNMLSDFYDYEFLRELAKERGVIKLNISPNLVNCEKLVEVSSKLSQILEPYESFRIGRERCKDYQLRDLLINFHLKTGKIEKAIEVTRELEGKDILHKCLNLANKAAFISKYGTRMVEELFGVPKVEAYEEFFHNLSLFLQLSLDDAKNLVEDYRCMNSNSLILLALAKGKRKLNEILEFYRSEESDEVYNAIWEFAKLSLDYIKKINELKGRKKPPYYFSVVTRLYYKKGEQTLRTLRGNEL